LGVRKGGVVAKNYLNISLEMTQFPERPTQKTPFKVFSFYKYHPPKAD